MQAKLTYQQRYGPKAFLSLLKKHELHTGRGNRLRIVNELLQVLDDEGTREREVAKIDVKDDAKDEVLLKSKQVSKRRRKESPWLTEIAEQISFPLHKRLAKYLPKEIVSKTIAEWILQDVSISSTIPSVTHVFLTMQSSSIVYYSSHSSCMTQLFLTYEIPQL